MIWFNRFDPKAAIARLPEATVFMGVPTLYVRLLAEPALTREACAHMRLFIAGSAPLLIETFNDWRERTGHTILERYGMSETVMLTSNPYRAEDGERRGGTVGLPAARRAGARARRRRAQPCHSDEIGGIEVKGPNVFKGYWRMPEKTAEEFTPDGWFKTGDVGKIDEHGYVTIVGRSKDLIISGGYNVYPAEVEGYLNEHAGCARERRRRRAARRLRRGRGRGGGRPARRCARRRGADRGAEGQDRQLQGSQASFRRRRNCRAMRWARCRRTCCASSTKVCSMLPPLGDRCPRCGGGFHCGANDLSPCPCSSLQLDEATLTMLRERFRGCLCLACLREFAAPGQAQEAD